MQAVELVERHQVDEPLDVARRPKKWRATSSIAPRQAKRGRSRMWTAGRRRAPCTGRSWRSVWTPWKRPAGRGGDEPDRRRASPSGRSPRRRARRRRPARARRGRRGHEPSSRACGRARPRSGASPASTASTETVVRGPDDEGCRAAASSTPASGSPPGPRSANRGRGRGAAVRLAPVSGSKKYSSRRVEASRSARPGPAPRLRRRRARSTSTRSSASSASSSLSAAARSSSASTRGASIGKITCESEPSSSSTATSDVDRRQRRVGERRVLERLRADAEDHAAVARRPPARRRAGVPAREGDTAVGDGRLDEVHRRRADEARRRRGCPAARRAPAASRPAGSRRRG